MSRICVVRDIGLNIDLSLYVINSSLIMFDYKIKFKNFFPNLLGFAGLIPFVGLTLFQFKMIYIWQNFSAVTDVIYSMLRAEKKDGKQAGGLKDNYLYYKLFI